MAVDQQIGKHTLHLRHHPGVLLLLSPFYVAVAVAQAAAAAAAGCAWEFASAAAVASSLNPFFPFLVVNIVKTERALELPAKVPGG